MSPRVRERTVVGAVAGLLAGAIVVFVGLTETFRALEARSGDLRFRFERAVSASAAADSSIVIVDIDNRSLRLYRDEPDRARTRGRRGVRGGDHHGSGDRPRGGVRPADHRRGGTGAPGGGTSRPRPRAVRAAGPGRGDRSGVRRRVVRREITLLFSDVRNFTGMSERMDPERAVETLNDYLSAMVEVVFDHGGTLDKYLGDDLMAFFGAPLEDPDHALHACRAALKMKDRLEDLNATWETEGRPRLAIGVGIHTGETMVGFIGDEARRMDYTAIGDAVNLASRIEGLNKECGTTILLSEATLSHLDGSLETRPVGEKSVKGRAEPVRVHMLEKA